ncbi:PIN domain-containing protein [Cellulomonas wangsupingiae]|uniref:Ribonuclease VapC n=1 Tax=Cellulomonas wangsupingiae TaxID=2968085 RepID=A0ABY5K879_9CELL|nr:PIN domain-containing protein [Cellulomonas wangsupingiae]MCC2335110.1 PIN domain-containing protein [Cellulomonas wangsupingiae]MCM0638980.1 PIN domain-containing protein [Cellulomonas wangsupingiae]UUI65606.1 PIN domain-containing protein [Cellulomonas wangsupingiae]
MILLDTNVLVDLHLYALDPAEQYAVSILSRAELEFGVRAARSAVDTAARTRRLNELDELFDWLPFDVECTRSYGIVASTARASGARVRGKDALIAAQAHRHGAAVLTENVADFQPFDHVVQVVAPVRR